MKVGDYMGRQIRTSITISFATDEKVCYKRNNEIELERVKFIIQQQKKKRQNTAVLGKRGSQYWFMGINLEPGSSLKI